MWLSRDPIGEQINQPRLSLQLPWMRPQYKPSLNLYSYCVNDPIDNVDRMGLAVGDWWDPSTYGSGTGFWDSDGFWDPNAWQQSAAATADGATFGLTGIIDPTDFTIQPGNCYNQDASATLGIAGTLLVLAAIGDEGGDGGDGPPPTTTPPATPGEMGIPEGTYTPGQGMSPTPPAVPVPAGG